MSHGISQGKPQTTRKPGDRFTTMFTMGRMVQQEPVDTDSPLSPHIPGHSAEGPTWVSHQALKIPREINIQLSPRGKCSFPVRVAHLDSCHDDALLEPSCFSFFFKIYFMGMSVLPACVSRHHVYA